MGKWKQHKGKSYYEVPSKGQKVPLMLTSTEYSTARKRWNRQYDEKQKQKWMSSKEHKQMKRRSP